MKINPKSHKEAYTAQEKRGSFDVPPDGVYHVVNTKLKRTEIGAKSTPVVKVSTRILAVVSVEYPAMAGEAKSWVGKNVGQDMWWDLSKKGNQERVACMGIAHGQMDEWDPDNDAQLVTAATGVPYQMKSQRKVQGDFINLNVLATQQLSKEKRAEYTNAPDWKQLVGDPAQRMVNEVKGKKTNGNGKPAQTRVQDDDPFRDAGAPPMTDEDIPF